MNIVKIINNVAYKTVLVEGVNSDTFVNNNSNYYYTDVEINPDSHYDFINEEVIFNQDKTNEKTIVINKDKIEDILVALNKKLFVEGKFFTLTPEEQTQSFAYMALMSAATLVIPDMPDFLKEV